MSTSLFDVLCAAGLAQTPVAISGHPRIRQRVLVNLERRRRRDNLIAVSLVVMAGIGLLAFGLARSPLLSLDTVAVMGLSPAQQQIIHSQTGVTEGVNILDVDLSTVARRVEALPWVDDVTLRRRLPSTLEIRVATIRPVAAATSGQNYYLLDAEAKVVEVIPDDNGNRSVLIGDPSGLPRVPMSVAPQVGQAVADPAVKAAVVVAAGMPPPVRGWVVEYRAVTDGEVDARMRVPTESGPVDLMVHVGRPESLQIKAAALVALTEEVLALGIRPESLDLRIPDRPVIRT